MVKLTIDGRAVEVPGGSTVLEAARVLGISIPTLCHLPGVKENRPSCLACVVRIGDDAKVVPACSTVVSECMVVHSETPDVRAMRKAALELLFSDHLGDCVSICQRVCPARLQIPAMIRLVAAGEMSKAIALAKETVVFPGVLGRICKAPCEKGCRRSKHDGAVAIKLLEREVADADRASGAPYLPACRPSTGKRVAIVGAGPTGLSAAFFLLRAGHACTVLDDQAEAGGSMRRLTNEADLPRAVLDGEIDSIRRMGLTLRPGTRLGRDVSLEELRGQFDAVLLCVGDVKQAGEGLGVDVTARGIRVDASMLQTNVPGVFAAGAAVRGGFDPARTVGEGRVLAECVDAFLSGRVINAALKIFTSTIPRLSEEEHVEITKGSNAALSPAELTGEAGRAAGRCWHCDCRAATDCRLRNVSAAYGVEVNAFAGPHRRRFQFVRQPAGVIFEPGKCISCGICVEIAAKERVPLGLTFIGRGFDLKISVPLNGRLADSLERVAEDSVKHCPTGALAFEDEARTRQVRATGGHGIEPQAVASPATA
jgi:ferredoxin